MGIAQGRFMQTVLFWAYGCVSMLAVSGCVKPPQAPPAPAQEVEEEASSPFTWVGRAPKAPEEDPRLLEPSCQFVARETAVAKKSGLGFDALVSRISAASRKQGAAGSQCVTSFKETAAHEAEWNKDSEALVTLKALAKNARLNPTCLVDAPAVPAESFSDATFQATQEAWSAPGWRCLAVRSGPESHFRYAMYVDRRAQTFVLTAQRLDQPERLFFVRSKMQGSDEPRVLEKD